ncbi:Cupredoxin [Mycena floridula]|nr:Cupredoxin [Mycena floridula]
MRFSVLVAGLALASSALASTFNILVGENNGTAFNPSSISAQVGDIVAFTFVNKNHTVTQSTFAAPCVKMAGGTDSGFLQPNPVAGTLPQFSITVNVATPLWFYCAQTGHCTKGMVFAINPTADKSFATFQASAMGTTANTTSTTTSGAITLTKNPALILGLVGLVAGIML